MELIYLCAAFWGGSYAAARLILAMRGMWRAGYRVPVVVEVLGGAWLVGVVFGVW